MEGWKGRMEGRKRWREGDKERGSEGARGRGGEGRLKQHATHITQYAIRNTHYVSRFTFHVLRFTVLCIIFLYCLFIPPTEADSLINLPLNPEISDFNHETYAFVYRFLNKRALPGMTRGSLPLTRGQIASLLLQLSEKQASGEITLSQIDQSRLKALMGLFADSTPHPQPPSPKALGEGAKGVREGHRLHIMQLKGDAYRFAFDLAASQRAISRASAAFPMEGTAHITSLLPNVHGQVRDDFAFSTNIGYHFLYGNMFEDLFPDEASYSHFEGAVQNKVPIDAYLKFKLPWFELELGKDNLHWGPGYHGALLVSENPISMDMIKLQASYKHITFSAFTAILEDINSEMNSKYISGNRIEGYLWNRFGLGLSEVVVYGNRFEFAYLNPVEVYLVDEPNVSRGDSRVTGTGDNLLLSFDSRLRLTDNLELYGELMIDDGNPAVEFHNWDTKFGILGGVYVTDPLGVSDTDLHAEYAFINQYAYTHENPVNVYKHFGSVIGHFIGSDADDLWVELRHRFTDKLESKLTYELERHGEGNVDKPHPLDAPAGDRWKPLSGITQSKHGITLGVNYTAIGRYTLAVDFTQNWMRNMGHQVGVNEIGHEVNVVSVLEICESTNKRMG
ncbi:hypothetical protein HYR99_00190 [Candidatus Poribacteria bacterium]|nr:hypothetical protein [Candidatus Poribacteria bacterium]